jgi:hypothetical protein
MIRRDGCLRVTSAFLTCTNGGRGQGGINYLIIERGKPREWADIYGVSEKEDVGTM